jgi:hypothetical protein
MMERVNPVKIYFKHTYTYHNISPVQLLYANKIIKKEYKARTVHYPDHFSLLSLWKALKDKVASPSTPFQGRGKAYK